MGIEHTGESPRPLKDEEIATFLEKKGLKRIDMNNFTPGRVILCVLPNAVRSGDKNAPFVHLSPEQRPCVARIDNPLFFDPEASGANFATNGQIDYYGINKDGQPVLVKTNPGSRDVYHILPELVYEDSSLFPKSEV